MSIPEPAALRRHRLRPYCWLAITAAIIIIPLVRSVQEIQADRRHREQWPRVVGTVPVSYEAGRHEVPVQYRHPVTGQLVETKVVVVRESLLPEPGGEFTVAADPANPDRIVTPGDGDEGRDLVLGPIVILGAVLAAGFARWRSVSRMKRMVTSSRPSFAMLAALHPGGLWGRQVRCSLYALDGGPGAMPVCTFVTLVTAGLPINGPAFPVEVRGRPVPGGLLVARAGERILWPMRRPLTRGDRARPERMVEYPITLPPAGAPPRSDARPLSLFLSCGWLAPAFVLIAVVATIVTPPQLAAGSRGSDKLRDQGRAVVAEVVGKQGRKLTVRYDGGPDVGLLQTVTDGARRRVLGRLYPAHVDPADPSKLRLDADPYEVAGPLSYLLSWWGITVLVVWPRLRWWLQARRAARSGPWYGAVVSYEKGNLFLHAAVGAAEHVAACRSTPQQPTPPFDATIAGTLDPGEGLVIVGPRRASGPLVRERRAWRRK